VSVAAAILLSVPSVCSAEIATLTSGRTLSIASHRFEGSQVVLLLRAGGEIACDRALVSRIDPDEVPYPEPDALTAAEDDVPIGGPYREVIEAAAARHGLEARLLESVIRVESNFSHRARSRKGAMGLMQLMPATARQYALRDPYDPAGNIDAGARHLRTLLDRFDLPVALAAYNAGEAAVARYGGVPPFRETRAYVARILRLVEHPSVQSSR
jgi:soluble lytic murein transglycosylase-like protein